MAGNTFGSAFKVTTFGESHGPALGAVIDGCPAGVPISAEHIQQALNRRRPGYHPDAAQGSAAARNSAVTSRSEKDECEILSGVFDGVSTGTPVALLIRNTSQRSKDYDAIKNSFRPGHADCTYTAKYGLRDYRGGGRSSGRETAARVAAGAVARQILKQAFPGCSVTAYTIRAAGVSAKTRDLDAVEQNQLRCCDNEAAALMLERISALRADGDSAGGVVECTVAGIPAGLGEPVFDKLDAKLAQAIVSIGAVKGIEFGEGFSAADLTGSAMNDSIRSTPDARGVCFETNRAGGTLGGISNGSAIVFRAAIKPVPSIFRTQRSVQLENGAYTDSNILIEGRHDVCLCPRIVPVIEAMTYITLADLYLQNRAARIR